MLYEDWHAARKAGVDAKVAHWALVDDLYAEFKRKVCASLGTCEYTNPKPIGTPWREVGLRFPRDPFHHLMHIEGSHIQQCVQQDVMEGRANE